MIAGWVEIIWREKPDEVMVVSVNDEGCRVNRIHSKLTEQQYRRHMKQHLAIIAKGAYQDRQEPTPASRAND